MLAIGASVRATQQRLAAADVDADESVLEARVLHQEALGLTTAQLLSRLDLPLSTENQAALDRVVERRLTREPLAYILGHREFYGLDLRVDSRVLIPRPETELVVEAALALIKRLGLAEPRIVDVGTGSGAIALALATQLVGAHVVAIDRSPAALEVAAENVRLHRLDNRIVLLAGDLLTPLRSSADLIVANLPYVPDSDLATLAPEVRDFEPSLALAGGPDGLDLYRRLVEQARSCLRRPGALVLEIGEGQSAAARELTASAFPDATVCVISDLACIPRIVTAIIT